MTWNDFKLSANWMHRIEGWCSVFYNVLFTSCMRHGQPEDRVWLSLGTFVSWKPTLNTYIEVFAFVVVILSPSTIDKMFEIFGPIFEQNASINFEPIFEKSVNFGHIFEKSVNFGPIFEKSVNFEHFVNGRWTHYKYSIHLHRSRHQEGVLTSILSFRKEG